MAEYSLFSWGANSHGQLGHGNIEEDELLIPREVNLSCTDIKPENVIKIIGGAGHTLLLDKFGTVYSCGWNDKGQAGIMHSSALFQKVECLADYKIIDIACGWDSSMALTENGQIFSWGSNSHGQLGLKSISIGGKIGKPTKVDLNVSVQKISMGLRHAALVTQKSKVLVSGAGTKGQLGIDLNGVRCSNSFKEVPELQSVNNVACGQHHTVIATGNNEIFAWGDNKHGQLGLDPSLCKAEFLPTKVRKCENISVKRIYCGWTHSAILTADKKVISWGRNTYGQLGRTKYFPQRDLWNPKILQSLTKVEQLSVGSEHNIVLTDDKTIFSWGWNEHGNCGNGNIEDTFTPTKVLLPEGSGFLVGTGAGHSFAIIKMYC